MTEINKTMIFTHKMGEFLKKAKACTKCIAGVLGNALIRYITIKILDKPRASSSRCQIFVHKCTLIIEV